MFQWLSSFMMNPAMAIGAGAVASPILIHILSKRRFRRLRWAAMEFLLEAQKRNRRRVRLEQLILLFLRCLAVFLVALMIMRPFVRPGAFASILGAAPRSERVVLLDDSFSMDYRPSATRGGGKSLFEKAVDSTLQLARWAAEEAPGDTLSVVLTSNPGEPLVALKNLSDQEIERLRQHIASIRPSQLRAHMSDAIAAVADTMARSPTQANTAIYIVSDFQRADWIVPAASAPDAEKPRSPVAPLTALSRGGAPVKLVLMNVGDASPGNAAILSVESLRPQAVAGVPTRFEARIANYSATAMEQVELGISIAESRLPPVLVNRISPGQVVREPIEVTFPQDGPNFLRVELAGADRFGDVVRVDNVRLSAVDVASVIQVLVVDGESSNDSYKDEVYLLKTALRPAGRAASGNELTVIDDQELESTELNSFHVVILANVARPGGAALRNLDRFVRDGGGLIIFGGDQIDIDHYNTELFRGGAGLLPVELGDVIETPAGVERMTFGQWDREHPIMRSFEGSLAELLRQVKVFAFVSTSNIVEQPAASAPASTGKSEPASQPADAAESPARVVARFNDADGSPAIVQRRAGRGAVIFIATSADQEWNDWAANFSYLPMMLELVQFSARSSNLAGGVTIGRPLVCEFDPSRFEPRAALRPPDYPVEPEIPLDAVANDGQADRFEYHAARQCGLYQFRLNATGGAGRTVVQYAAINPDPTESNFASASRPELDSALAEDMPFEYVADATVLADQAAGARQEFWWPLLVAAVLVLMTEQTLAWWFGKRG